MAHVIYEEENIVNLKIEGQPKTILSISDPMTDASADDEVTIAYA